MLLLLPILALIILVLGGAYVLSLRTARSDGAGWRAVGFTGLGAGLAAIVLTALAALFTLTPFLEGSPLRDPLAAISFLGIPAALVGLGCGALGVRSHARGASISGLALSAATLVAWTLMQVTLGG